MPIAWDVGNVIIFADQNITQRILVKNGVTPKRASTFFTNEEYCNFSRGLITAHQFCDALRNTLLHCDLSDEELRRAHDEHMTGVNEDLCRVIEKCGTVPMLFLTDTNDWQTAREKELIDLHRYAQIAVRSHKIHELKSDPGYYQKLSGVINQPLHHIVLVDDNSTNIAKAMENGLRTVLYTSADQTYSDLRNLKVL